MFRKHYLPIVLHILLISHFFQSPFHNDHWLFHGECTVHMFYLKTNILYSFILCVLPSCESVLITPTTNRNFTDEDWKILICESNDKSFWIALLYGFHPVQWYLMEIKVIGYYKDVHAIIIVPVHVWQSQ